MMALVSSDELAKDVTGAEALLERHQVRASSSLKDILYKERGLSGFDVINAMRWCVCVMADSQS